MSFATFPSPPWSLLAGLGLMSTMAAGPPARAAEQAVEQAAERSPLPPDAPDETRSRTVVFVYGLYVNAQCWDGWRAHFESQGFRTLAPEWPGHAGPPAELREHPPRPWSS